MAGVMPMLECFSHVKVSNSLGNLGDLSAEFSIIKVVFSDCLKACSKQLCVPFLGQFLGSLSHVKSNLCSLEPLS